MNSKFQLPIIKLERIALHRALAYPSPSTAIPKCIYKDDSDIKMLYDLKIINSAECNTSSTNSRFSLHRLYNELSEEREYTSGQKSS